MNFLSNPGLKLSVSALLVLIILAGDSVAAQEWVPPDNPDLEEILDGADVDAQEGRLKLAAEKYHWYHERVLTKEVSSVGVPSSFEIGYWDDLADMYPPARRDMRLFRDKAEESLRGRNSKSSVFYVFQLLNGFLQDDGRTIELFKWLDENNRRFARSVFPQTQGILVAGGEYALCEKYMVGQNSFDRIHEDYVRSRQQRGGKYERELGQLSAALDEQMFARRASLIVVVLANRDRLSEAELIAEKTLEVLRSETNKVRVRDALKGIPPQ